MEHGGWDSCKRARSAVVERQLDEQIAHTPGAAHLSTSTTLGRVQDKEVFEVQKTMAEAWTIVTQTFVDSTFNDTGALGCQPALEALGRRLHRRAACQLGCSRRLRLAPPLWVRLPLGPVPAGSAKPKGAALPAALCPWPSSAAR